MTKKKQEKSQINFDWKDKWAIVTTDKDRKGVFYGKIKEWDREKGIILLKNAKMIVYWSEETKGVLGLAAKGPAEMSRVTSAVPVLELNGVTAIMLATEDAQKRFQEEIWA